MNQQQNEYNTTMSQVLINIKKEFVGITNLFKFLDFKKISK